MFCKNCGYEIGDKAVVCVHCGVKIKHDNPSDGSIGALGILCFFFPILGLILYLVWLDTKPIKAKGAGKATLFGIGTGILIWILIIFAAAGSAGF